MSEAALGSSVTAPPRKRRRWILGVLLTLLVCGGAYWWRNRLMPDERIFVGRWKFVDPSMVPPAKEKFIELYSDRTGYNDGIRFRWTAHQGELSFWEEHPFHRLVLQWVQNGFKDWGIDGGGRYEVINHDKILILESDGKLSAEMIRVIGVQPEAPAEP